jgi:uncharacterized iron-regulated membrane protein
MTTKTKRWTARRIHLWIGIGLAIPMTFMAITGILISMRSVGNIDVPMSWLGSEAVPKHLPIMAYTETSDGALWIGNAQGLNKIKDNQVSPVTQFAGQEIVGLAALPNHTFPIVATKMAVWSENNGNWQSVLKGRVRQLSTFANGQVFAIAGGRGELADGKPMISNGGQQWQVYQPSITANSQLPDLENPRVALHQFMREIHSGAFLFGKGIGEMVWSNVLGWILLSLSLTGLWMWLKIELHKAIKRIKSAETSIDRSKP